MKDLLDRSLLEKKSLVPDYSLQNLSQVIKEVIQIMEVQASHKQIRISFDSDLPSKRLKIDVNRIQQVLINLIGNAIKFSHTNTEVSINLFSEAGASTKTKSPKNLSLKMHSKVA